MSTTSCSLQLMNAVTAATACTWGACESDPLAIASESANACTSYEQSHMGTGEGIGYSCACGSPIMRGECENISLRRSPAHPGATGGLSSRAGALTLGAGLAMASEGCRSHPDSQGGEGADLEAASLGAYAICALGVLGMFAGALGMFAAARAMLAGANRTAQPSAPRKGEESDEPQIAEGLRPSATGSNETPEVEAAPPATERPEIPELGALPPRVGGENLKEAIRPQRLLLCDRLTEAASHEFGAKAALLTRMWNELLPVPRFVILQGDGTGHLTLTEQIKTAFRYLQRMSPIGSVMVRSAHSVEGSAGAPFSGVFESIGGVKDTDMLVKACADIVEGARDQQTLDYVRKHGVRGYQPEEMNFVLMPEMPLNVFARFMTSSATNPQETVIECQVMLHTIAGKTWSGTLRAVYDSEMDRITNEDDVMQFLRENRSVDSDLFDVLFQFGRRARHVEASMGGVMQVEMGAVPRNHEEKAQRCLSPDLLTRMAFSYADLDRSPKTAFVFQARNMPVKKEDSPPSEAGALSSIFPPNSFMCTAGSCDETLPVLVIDADPRLAELERSSYGDRPPDWDEQWKKALKAYHRRLSNFVYDHESYILVLGRLDHFLAASRSDRSPGGDFELLNHNFIRKAKVLLHPGTDGMGIAHGDIAKIERGEVVVLLHSRRVFPYEEYFDQTAMPDSLDKGQLKELGDSGSDGPDMGWTRQPLQRIYTGDRCRVVANKNGVFISKVDMP